MKLEVLAASFIIGRPRRDHFQQRLGQGQDVRLQRCQNGRKGAPLFRRGHDFGGRLSVTAQRKCVVHSADEFAGCLHLIAMHQVKRHQHVFECCQRRSFPDVILAEAL